MAKPEQTKSAKSEIAKPYERTPTERAAIEKFRKAGREKPTLPHILVKDGGNGLPSLVPDHPDQTVGSIQLMQAIGTTDVNFLNGILSQVANTGSHGPKLEESGLNFMLSVIGGIEPRDQVEAMLAAQMAAVHSATMTFARRLNHVENIPQQDSAERAFNKLARTFATQIEALKRYRSKGEQKMTVEHVTVNEGGQAIVGSVQSGGGGASKKSGTTP